MSWLILGVRSVPVLAMVIPLCRDLIPSPGYLTQCEAGADASGGGAPPAEARPLSRVSFRMQHRVAWGETLKVVGDSEALGDWDTASAPSAHRAVSLHP